jgi:LCP family protein required for cell wall assembly
MTRIAAGRKARQQRVMLLALSAMSALVLLVAGASWALTSYVSGNLGRLDAGTAGTPSSGPLNVLVAGVDVRSGLTRHQQLALHVGRAVSTNSDTLMVVHVPADHRYVQVVSLPRDSWVAIPGHGMNKINAAFGLGGPRLMVRTVERNTGLTINDYIEVNFLGFVRVIDALGGVNICLPYAVNDPYSGLRMSAGVHHVGGITALKFARDRHSFALSDLARIGHQQQLLASLLRQAISSGTLANPVKLTRFLSSATAAIKVDQGLNVDRLANELRGIRPGDVTFTTVPLGNMNYQTPAGQSAVLWNASAAGSLFAQLKHDQPPPRGPRRPGHLGHQRHSRRPRLRRAQVSVDIYNGTLIGGLSAQTGSELASLHFGVHRSGLTWNTQNVSQTVIDYPAGQKAAARLIRHVMPGAILHRARGLRRLRIVLGQAGYQITAPASAAPGSAPGAAKTAAQAACR